MAGEAISGKDGYIIISSCDVAEFGSWDATISRAINKYNARSGGGWQKVVRGNEFVSGTISGKYTPAEPIETHINVDTYPTLQLHMNTTDYWTGQAMFGDIKYAVNNDTGEITGWSVDFESEGSWTKVS